MLQTYKKVLLKENFVVVSGQLQIDEGVINIIAQHAAPLIPLVDSGFALSSRDFH